jgi:16S rRNA (uracil1498-N3)-methyltransferase
MHKENHSFFFLSAVSEKKGLLTEDEHRHACRALRMAPNAALYGTDGKGNIYKCMLTPRSEESGEIDIVETFRQEPTSPVLRMFIGLPDREPFEEALPGLCALGASEIVPIVCRYCQEQWWRPWEKRIERLRRKMIASIKQAHNPWLPDLREPRPFSDALRLLDAQNARKSLRVVADPGGSAISSVIGEIGRTDHIDCFIGPPGGFSPEELGRLSSENFNRVGLSRFRLRTELAAVASCAQIMQCFLEAGETPETRADCLHDAT